MKLHVQINGQPFSDNFSCRLHHLAWMLWRDGGLVNCRSIVWQGDPSFLVINGYFAIWTLQVSLAHCLELNYLSGYSFLELDSLSAYLSVGMALTSMPAHPSFFSVCSFNTIFHPFYTLVYPQRYEQSDLDMNAMQNLLANSMAVFEGWFRRCCS